MTETAPAFLLMKVTKLSRHWEAEFQKDMAALGVRPPAAWLRVSDHMPQIIAFIQRLVDGARFVLFRFSRLF